MSNLLELYQKYSPYQITDHIQELNFTFNVERLRQELFKFIVDNKFGFSTVSLRVLPGQNDYISKEERMEAGSINPHNFDSTRINVPENIKLNKEYINWHPDLEHSYLASLVTKIEKICGLNIGRIRLAWLQPNCGYPMHTDLEPMRLVRLIAAPGDKPQRQTSTSACASTCCRSTTTWPRACCSAALSPLSWPTPACKMCSSKLRPTAVWATPAWASWRCSPPLALSWP